jgi:hypothetical protein
VVDDANDHEVLGSVDDFLQVVVFMPWCDKPGRWMRTDTVVFGDRRRDGCAASRHPALAEKVVRLVEDLKRLCNASDTLVHVSQDHLIVCLAPEPRHISSIPGLPPARGLGSWQMLVPGAI